MDATTLKARLDQALKEALLSGDTFQTTVLRGLKSAILYVEVAEQKREVGLNDSEIQIVLAKEAKKRQESADLYAQGGNTERAALELKEKAIIETYLPPQISDEDLQKIVDSAVSENLDLPMGQIIGIVKKEAGLGADGAKIAALVRARIGA